MFTKVLISAAAVTHTVVALRFEPFPPDNTEPTTISPSGTASAFTGPITPGPLLPWSNGTSPWANTTSPTSSDPHCFDCPGWGYSYASSCSQASQEWTSASYAWSLAHYTVSHSILSSLHTYTTFVPGPRHRNVLGQCWNATPLFIISNVLNLTVVRPEFSAEAASPTSDFRYPVDVPTCTINRLDCSSLWDVHDARPTAQPAPECNDYALHLPCFAPYFLPTDYSLYVPSVTWTLPTTAAASTPSIPPFFPINTSDLPGGLFAPMPHHSTATATAQQQPQQPTQQPTQKPTPQSQAPPSPQSSSPSPASPITTTTIINNIPLTATIYPPQTLPSTTIAPSIVIAGTTLLPSSPPITVDGAVLSAALPSGALISVASTTITPTFSTLAGSAPALHPAGANPQEEPTAVEQITVAGHTWTVTSSGSALIFGPGTTASVGGPAITLVEPAVTSSPITPSASSLSAVPSDDSPDVEVVSAAPGGGIIVVHQSTVIAMPTGTGDQPAGPSATQDQGQGVFGTNGVASEAALGSVGTEAIPEASLTSASALASTLAVSSSTAPDQAPGAIATHIKGGAAPSGSLRSSASSEDREQGAAAGLATPKSWTLWLAAAGTLAVLHLAVLL